jgi:hypothetical protein
LQEKELNVAQVLHEDEWIRKLAIDATTSIEHLTQFEQLWANIQMVHLREDVEDDITWELTGNGQYSVASAYNLQKKIGLVDSSFNEIIWKAWATPKSKHHAWLALQYRLWMADRLNRQG